jgi:hypothetical protein
VISKNIDRGLSAKADELFDPDCTYIVQSESAENLDLLDLSDKTGTSKTNR